MDRVSIGPVKGLKIALAAFLLSIVLFLAVLGGGAYLFVSRNNDLHATAVQLREGLVRSCQRNGNPLRKAVQRQIRERIQQREHLDFTRFFPNVPPGELNRLLAQENRADRVSLKQIAPIDCKRLYPAP